MKPSLNSRTFLQLLVPAVFLVFSCDPGSNVPEIPTDRFTGDPITIAGKLGTEFTALVSAPKSFSPRSIGSAVSGESYLMLLVNEYATVLGEKCTGVLALRSGTSSDLVALPLDLAKRNLDFGTVSLSGDAAVASTTLESQQENFDLTFDQLFEAAIRGNLYKHIKNLYVNYDKATGDAFIDNYRPMFDIPLSAAKNIISPPEQTIARIRYQMSYNSNTPDPDHAFGKLNVSYIQKIYPPYELPIGNPGFTKTCSPTVPLLSTDTGIFNSQSTPWSPGGFKDSGLRRFLVLDRRSRIRL